MALAVVVAVVVPTRTPIIGVCVRTPNHSDPLPHRNDALDVVQQKIPTRARSKVIFANGGEGSAN